jgi:SPW repeat
MAVHNLGDIAAGLMLAASPWLFGFADESVNVWAPHVVVGLAAIFLGLTAKQQGGYRYRTATAQRVRLDTPASMFPLCQQQ